MEPKFSRRFALLSKQIRMYQWSKNLLLFVPIGLAHSLSNYQALLQCFYGFLAFSFTASAVYVVNDVLDREHDRIHPRKRFRPIASGQISVKSALLIALILVLTAVAICVALMPLAFNLWLVTYAVLTTAYSLYIKRVVLVDVITLAGLYALRVAAGGAAADVVVSPWLLGFSLFLFMSLAFLKRYTELRDTIERDGRVVSGRGYHAGDSELVLIAGTALGLVSVLVFTLYVNGPQVQALYSHPTLLWLVAPCLVYWISHLWLTAHRGGMHDDPIVFAFRDRSSWAVGAAIVAIAGAASL